MNNEIKHPADSAESRIDGYVKDAFAKRISKDSQESAVKEVSVEILVKENLLKDYAHELYTAMMSEAPTFNSPLRTWPEGKDEKGKPIMREITEEMLLGYFEDRIRDRVAYVRRERSNQQFQQEDTVYTPALLLNYLKLIGRCENPNGTLSITPVVKETKHSLSKDDARRVGAFLKFAGKCGFAVGSVMPRERAGSMDFMMLNLLDNRVASLCDVPPVLAMPAAILGIRPDHNHYAEDSYDIILATKSALRNVIREVVENDAKHVTRVMGW